MRLPAAAIEGLERRTYLDGSSSATVTARGTLSIAGSSLADAIDVSLSADQIVVAINGTSASFPASVKRVYIDAGAGDDAVTCGLARPTTVLAGDGDDTVNVSGPSTLSGGAGNDFLAGDSNDSIDAGDGNDTILAADGDTITGGAGTDAADFSHHPGGGIAFHLGFNVNPDGGTFPNEPYVQAGDIAIADPVEIIRGTAFDDLFDQLAPPATPPTLFGGDGDDVFDNIDNADIDGGLGNDRFITPSLHTTVSGGRGNDIFDLEVLPASIRGGEGTDRIVETSNLIPVLDLSRWQTSIEQADGIGTLIGNPNARGALIALPSDLPVVLIGYDSGTLIGDPGKPNYIYGGDGNDLIIGGNKADTIFGNFGNDTIYGGAGNDTIHGGEQNDLLIGGKGRDHLYGDDGNDGILAKDKQVDTLFGGAGDFGDKGKDVADVDKSTTVKDIWSEIEKIL